MIRSSRRCWPSMRRASRAPMGYWPQARSGMKVRLTPQILILFMASLPMGAAESRMTAEERAQALKWLEQSRQEFLAAIDGVSEQQWKWKPSPDRWSVGEV